MHLNDFYCLLSPLIFLTFSLQTENQNLHRRNTALHERNHFLALKHAELEETNHEEHTRNEELQNKFEDAEYELQKCKMRNEKLETTLAECQVRGDAKINMYYAVRCEGLPSCYVWSEILLFFHESIIFECLPSQGFASLLEQNEGRPQSVGFLVLARLILFFQDFKIVARGKNDITID